jgi:signal transduction histidine kinase
VIALLQKLHQIILYTAEPDEIGAKITQALAESFEVDGCLWMTQSDTQITIHLTGRSASAPNVSQSIQGSEPKALLQFFALPSGTILVSGESSTKERPSSIPVQLLLQACNQVLAHWQLPAMQTLLGTVVEGPNNRKGAIVLLKNVVHEWPDAEISKLKTISDLTAIALNQSIQQRHMRTLQRDIFLANTYQSLSQNVLGNLNQSLAQEHLLQLALQTTVQTLQAERGFLLLLKYETPLLKRNLTGDVPKAKVVLNHEWVAEGTGISTYLNSEGQANTATSAPWFWLSECQLCQSILNHFDATLNIENIQADPTVVPAQTAPIFNLEQFSSLLVVPLLASSQSSILGFWVLQHRQPRIWSDFEQKFAESISVLAGSVILHNQALRQVNTLVEERTAQLEQNQRIQTKLYEITRQQVDQLRQLNQLKDEFLDTLSHELRTPLTSMKMAITMLRQPGMLRDDRANKYLDVLEHEWARENSLIQDLLLLQELESSTGISPSHTTNVGAMVTELAAELKERWQAKQIFLHIEQVSDFPTISTDPQSLRRVLQELLINAGKFARSQTTVHLQLSTEATPKAERVVFTLTNYGIGITPSEQTVIFDKFRRGQGVTKQAIPGVGLGLALVKCFVKQLQGEIEVASHPVIESEGFWETRFTLHLPLQPMQESPMLLEES